MKALDPRRRTFGDLSANSPLDSIGNLLGRPAVGMVFGVPALWEPGGDG